MRYFYIRGLHTDVVYGKFNERIRYAHHNNRRQAFLKRTMGQCPNQCQREITKTQIQVEINSKLKYFLKKCQFSCWSVKYTLNLPVDWQRVLGIKILNYILILKLRFRKLPTLQITETNGNYYNLHF